MIARQCSCLGTAQRPSGLHSTVRLSSSCLPLRKLTIQAIAAPPAAPSSVTTNGNGSSASYSPPPQQIVVQTPEPIPGVLPPAAAYENIVKLGTAKANMPAWKTFLMGILAGCFIAFGGLLAVAVGGTVPGLAASSPGLQKLLVGLVFPFGLMIALICGAELYTGNTAMVTAAVYEKKATVGQLAKNWFWSYLGNFVGSLVMVGLVAATGVLATNGMPLAMAAAKTSLTFTQAFVRGILCNWLVCAAVWMCAAATSLPGKTLGCWLPVTAFVTIGLEHSVANMFFIAMGMVLGAKVTIGQFLLGNLLPVTLGNTLGGFLCMATAYSLCYGALGKPAAAAPAKTA